MCKSSPTSLSLVSHRPSQYLIHILLFLDTSSRRVQWDNGSNNSNSLTRPMFFVRNSAPDYIDSGLEHQTIGNVNMCENSTILNGYLTQWYTLGRYKFFLKKLYSNKLLGSYPVSKFYFFYNNIFYPSDGNILIFNKSMRRLKLKKLFSNKIIPSHLISYFMLSSAINYFNYKANLGRSLKGPKSLLISQDKNIKWSRLTQQLLRSNLKNFKFEKRKKIWISRRLVRFYKKLLRKFLRRSRRRPYKFNNSRTPNKYPSRSLINLVLVDLVYKPSFSSRTVNNSSIIRKKVNYFKTSLGGTLALNILKNNLKLPNQNILLFKKHFTIALTFKFSMLIKQFFFTYNGYFFFHKNGLTNLLPKDCLYNTNLLPSSYFNYTFKKILVLFRSNLFLKENLTPWVYNNLIRFIEYCSGKKSFLQLYPFMNQSISLEFVILYKRWLPRFLYFEKKLGHRFFMEEAFHIIHMGFNLHDVKLISTWLSAIIKRISFWKTRLIFRFIKYVFNNYYLYIFNQIGIKGFKVKLKGKISVAGNSRKRSILYRVGKTSHSTTDLKVLYNLSTIITFTGVQGLQVWIFY